MLVLVFTTLYFIRLRNSVVIPEGCCALKRFYERNFCRITWGNPYEINLLISEKQKCLFYLLTGASEDY